MTSIEELVSNAEGESVSSKKLTGEKRYYSNVTHLCEDEEPHHLLFTKSSGDSVEIDRTELGVESASFLLTDKSIQVYGESDRGRNTSTAPTAN
ncbi:hypothetical protein M0R89_02750 [Halorussus limi]|uniref:Uncharacterized protein n=1 Tax=Halorussus limi TaxID=2938695 RepID=A0A8U0HWN0_9EURY|nr:hypothetical protein [Halorussus limi]UPV74994.1 hypothetical protein M0R89_02750 [Halorussus limi]